MMRTSLSNIGIGHYALDGGVGYTYFNPQTGHELSAVAGLTNNYINPYTNYKNGVDFHLDWGASQFLSKQVLIGAVGYVYNQLTGDSGSGDHVGPFKSRVVGVGPQVGYIFPLGNYQGYLNLKGYGEFDAHDRPSGYNAWLTFSISPGGADTARERVAADDDDEVSAPGPERIRRASCRARSGALSRQGGRPQSHETVQIRRDKPMLIAHSGSAVPRRSSRLP